MWIKTYIITIVTIVIFSSMAEAIMPDTNMKKHISLVAGLIVLLAIAKPIISIPKLSYDNIILNLSEVKTTSKELSEKIFIKQSEEVNDDFVEKTSEMVTKAINNHFNSKYSAEAIMYNDSDIKIKINCVENDVIKDYVKTNYGFECIFEKDDG